MTADADHVIDYFFICGLDSTPPPATPDGTETVCRPVSHANMASLLFHYPTARANVPFDPDATRTLALPYGVQFITADQTTIPSPEFHSFLITRQDGSRAYGFSYVFYEDLDYDSDHQSALVEQLQRLAVQTEERVDEERGADNTGQHVLPPSASHSADVCARAPLRVSKCIGVLMSVPYLHLARTFLTQLHRHCAVERFPMPLESLLCQLLHQLPAPTAGTCTCVSVSAPVVSSSSSCWQCLVQLPSPAELPLLEFSLGELVDRVGVSALLSLLSCLLLEHQIVLVSQVSSRLMLAGECVCALLFPFAWPHVYVPLLPAAMIHFLDAPVPYLMGVTRDSFSAGKKSRLGNVCMFDVDSGFIELPEDLPQLPCFDQLLQELSEQLAERAADRQASQRKQPDRDRHRSHGADGATRVANHSAAAGAANRRWSLDERCQPQVGTSGRTRYRTAACHLSQQQQQQQQQPEVYPGQHARLQRFSQLVKNAGLNFDRLAEQAMAHRNCHTNQYIDDQRRNNVIREVVLNRFVHTFLSYDSFIVLPSQDIENWMAERNDTSSNFDRVAFLSDQPRDHLPFLSRFVETQLFTMFIDRKLLSVRGECDASVTLFDLRIKRFRRMAESLVRSPTYERCSTVAETEALLLTRLQSPALHTPSLHQSPAIPELLPTGTDATPVTTTTPVTPVTTLTTTLTTPVSTTTPTANTSISNNNISNGKFRFPLPDTQLLKTLERQIDNFDQGEKRRLALRRHFHRARAVSDVRHNQLVLRPSLVDKYDADVTRNDNKFVEHALKDCKARTKRLLVAKMGAEAAAIGHGWSCRTVVGVEENTLIASLCDLLERIWTHGRNSAKGKSPLWCHLLCYRERHNQRHNGAPQQPSGDTVASAPSPSSATTGQAVPSPRASGRRSKLESLLDPVDDASISLLPALSTSLEADIANVESLSDLRTEIGCARAWMRVALEKKLLAKHLRQLLSDHQLLLDLYKPYAFLRCEEEKEQLLCHLLSLNAVDYSAFTNNYTQAVMLYRVLIVTSSKQSAATTTANVWLRLSGSLAETAVIQLPRRTHHVTFKHKNLGVLSTVQLGHDNSGASPNWLPLHVLARCELSGAAWRFPCRRWLGRSVDDGSIERVLVAESQWSQHHPPPHHHQQQPQPPALAGLAAVATIGGAVDGIVARRSSSLTRRAAPPEAHQLQQTLTDSVNCIVKHFHRAEKERGSLAHLLCGERGLVPSLQQLFLFGFRCNRLFGKNLYLWDYLARVRQQCEVELHQQSSVSCSPPSSPCSGNPLAVSPSYGADTRSRVALCRLIADVDQTNSALGKDDRFQAWLLVAIRERLLVEFVGELAASSVTGQMFEQLSFLRSAELLHALTQLLRQLHAYDVRPERQLLRGVRVSTRRGRSRSLLSQRARG